MAYDGTIKIDTSIDGKGFQDGLKKLGGIAATGIAAVTAALGAGFVYAAKTGMEFEAQMSRVKAISGATAEEFQKLNEQAKQLGADTAFSATEAAQGMENLASAGFTTTEIMEAMPGMLNLAASAGEDLATSSDIAASTLRGFGLAASDAGHVADVLAKNAAQTNAAVLDTGYAMKYIAPVAQTAGWSLESVTAAIGEMADAGIKGEQAGTTLRGALTRLMKPSKPAAEAMDAIGFSAYDAAGKMKPLSQMIGELSDKTKALSEEQRNQYIAQIFGTESLSGMTVLLQKGGPALDKMTESLKSSDGAADEMAKTMQDNLKGAIEQLGGSVETLGIELYEGIDNPLKDVVNNLGAYIDQLTDAFKSGGVDGLIAETGTVFASLATDIANQTPAIITAGVNAIQSFLTGIQQNSGRISIAAVGIVTALISGMISITPQLVTTGIDLALGLIDGLSQTIPQLIPIAIGAVLSLADNLVGNIDKIVDAGIQLLLGLAQGIMDSLPTLIEKVPVIINNFADAVYRNLPNILAAGVQLIVILGKGIINSIPTIIANAGEIVKAIINVFTLVNLFSFGTKIITGLGNGIKSLGSWIKTRAGDIMAAIKSPFASAGTALKDAGINLIKGLWNGISSVKKWILSKISGFMGDIVGGVKNFFQIKSPSRLMANEIGRFLPPGITVGMDKAMPAALQDMKAQMAAMMEQARVTISAEQARLGATFNAQSTYQLAYAGAAAQTQDSAESPSFFIENHLIVNDRELAVAAGPAFAKELGWKGGKK